MLLWLTLSCKFSEWFLNLSKCKYYSYVTAHGVTLTLHPHILSLYSLWFTTILDMILVGITGLACFATAITISVGLAVTCDKVNQKLNVG